MSSRIFIYLKKRHQYYNLPGKTSTICTLNFAYEFLNAGPNIMGVIIDVVGRFAFSLQKTELLILWDGMIKNLKQPNREEK